ncbi:sigma-70 family RNA polymerase sigma factor [uncultured Psychroserpens sp.]|uniref:RNA polymerase sigma factor n=1 Tax=uncultured Psychroserpens sp. TaxID=255436 RepID=UPI002620583C|nr:sigma-70 family RNA polymerase sigma factor [uncultured Psychroserpens sp.]
MTDDQLLIKDIIDSNSPRAYRALVEKYERNVFTVCIRILRNREEAEEVAQDVFIKGFKLLKTLKDHTKFPNWIIKIAYTKAIDRKRLKQIKKTDISQVNEAVYQQSETPFVLASLENRKELLMKIINKLDTQEATIISLYYLQDRSVKDISEITEMTISNVKVKLYRARNSLRLMISKEFKHEINDLL